MGMSVDDTGRPDSAASVGQAAGDAQNALVTAIASMLADPGFLFPLAAASRQFRTFYYGMGSAALLEDVFVDAFHNHLAQRRPDLRFRRPPRGEKGWDYEYCGLKVSHKVGQGPTDIAVLWDATVERGVHSFDYPVVFVSSQYAPIPLRMDVHGQSVQAKALRAHRDQRLTQGNDLVIVHWPARTAEARVVGVVTIPKTGLAADVASFSDIWALVAPEIAKGTPANEIEVLHRAGKNSRGLLRPGDRVTLSSGLRPGVYVLVVEQLQLLPLKSNNRALLVDKDTVKQKMGDAAEAGQHIPMSTWAEVFASPRPPDLYLSQRAQWDARFSPAGTVGHE